MNPTNQEDGARIVVAVDGSAGSLAALRFAFAEARMRDAELQAVCAWRYPDTYGAPIVFPNDVDFEEEARRTLDEAIATVIGDGDVPVTALTVRGDAVNVLLDAAVGAVLLVVGSRGRGGFTGLLLGSVSQQLAQHAPCPIVIISPSADASGENTIA